MGEMPKVNANGMGTQHEDVCGIGLPSTTADLVLERISTVGTPYIYRSKITGE